MRKTFGSMMIALALFASSTSAALAGFVGQVILGPLGPGSVVNGDTTGHTDDNDGFTSGDHFFFIWNAPDDVWQLNWPGGDMNVQMTYDNTFYDLDLFLYEPGSYDDSGNYSIINSGIENISAPAAPAGTYYLVVDGPEAGDVGAYTISVTPEPATLGLIGLGVLGLISRRRRQ